jgi:hypothetical protein
MAGNAIMITPDVLMRVKELTAAGFKCKDLAQELSVTERKIYSLIERNIEFARAVAEGKKAFSDAEKLRKAKGTGRRPEFRTAAAKHTAEQKAAEKAPHEVKLAPSVEAQRVQKAVAAESRKAKIQAAMAPANTAPPPAKTEKPEELTEDAKLLFITPGMPNARLMNRYASRMVQLLDKMLDTSIETGRSNRLIELLVEVVYGWQKTQNIALTAKVERPVESMEDNKLIDVINIGADDE